VHKSKIKEWASTQGSAIMKHFAKKNVAIGRDSDGKQYMCYEVRDLENKSVFYEREYKEEAEDFFETQKRLLMKIAHQYDFCNLSGGIVYPPKILSLMAHPDSRGFLMEAPNFRFYSMDKDKPFEPRSRVFEFVNPQIADTLYERDIAYFESYYGITGLSREMICPRNFLVTDRFVKHTWKTYVGDPPENPLPEMTRVTPLWMLCVRKLSWYNQAYGGLEFPYVHNAVYNVPAVLPTIIRNLPKWDVAINKNFKGEWLLQSMVYYYKWNVDHVRVKWSFNPTDIELFPFSHKSIGARFFDAPECSLRRGGITINIKNSGYKDTGATMILRKFREVIREAWIATADYVPVEKHVFLGNTKLDIKDENLSSNDEEFDPPLGFKTPEIRNREDHSRGRLFFGSPDTIFHYLHGTRQAHERSYLPNMLYNVYNEIGTKWTYGGALIKARKLRWELMDQYSIIESDDDSHLSKNDLKTISWKKTVEGTQMVAEGDIKKLDLNIKAFMLYAYMFMGKMWIKQEDTHMYRFYCYLLEVCSEYLAGKHVCWFEKFCLIVGAMPSGSYDTSHGDTWIVAVFFSLFLVLLYCYC
jgi:hypothetical protein